MTSRERTISQSHGDKHESYPIDHADRFDEVLLEVVDELADAVVERRSDCDEVEHRDVLGVLAEADAPRMWADGHSELRGEQHDGQHLVDAAETAAVDLAVVDRALLKQIA